MEKRGDDGGFKIFEDFWVMTIWTRCLMRLQLVNSFGEHVKGDVDVRQFFSEWPFIELWYIGSVFLGVNGCEIAVQNIS